MDVTEDCNNSDSDEDETFDMIPTKRRRVHRTLKNMNATRWNSALNMLKSFIDLKGNFVHKN
jgi:hypothetical protein